MVAVAGVVVEDVGWKKEARFTVVASTRLLGS
jgi:hypothetical protein